MKDLNVFLAMRKYQLKHTVILVRFESPTEMNDRIDVLDLDMLSTYGQDDLLSQSLL